MTTYHNCKKDLEIAGHTIEYAQITDVDLSMADHGVLCLRLALEGEGWGCVFGGYVIGRGYVGAKEFSGYEKGIEYIMRIMDTVGVSRFCDMKNKYIRVAFKGVGSAIKIIGNIVEDKWFDEEEFFSEGENGL